jgi:hypothetical protein
VARRFRGRSGGPRQRAPLQARKPLFSGLVAHRRSGVGEH